MMGWQELGLGPGETEVYQALLAHPGVDFSSLARLVRLSREEVRDAITRLHSTGPVSYTHLDVYKRQPLSKP